MVIANRRTCAFLRNAFDALRFHGDSTFKSQTTFGGHPSRFLYRREQTKEQLPYLNARPPDGQISVEDGRRLLRLARLEDVKKRLQWIHDDCISYDELLRACMETLEGTSEEEAKGIAKLLDESGHVLVLNKTVYLRPYKIARTFEKIMPTPLAAKSDPYKEELERLEKEKVEIDQKAESHAMTELRLGLGFFGVQTAGLMRLTFWELSWDVMEPSFFNIRFGATQRRLMKKRNFDIERFKELRRLSRPGLKPPYCRGRICNCDNI